MSKTRMYRNAGARYLVDYFSFAAKQCSFRSHHTSGHHHASGVRRRVDSSTIKKWLVNKFAFNKDHDCFSHEKKRHRYLGAGRRADCVLAGILFVMGAALISWMVILLFTMPFPRRPRLDCVGLRRNSRPVDKRLVGAEASASCSCGFVGCRCFIA